MFRHQTRKLKILFAFADALLTLAAFTLAYNIREFPRFAHFRHTFFLKPDVYTLLLVFCLMTWAAVGYRIDAYGKLEAARIRVILAHTLRQAAICGLALIVLVYAARTDTSRFFLGLFVAMNCVFLIAFRIAARSFISHVSRKLGAERNIFVVGLGKAALAHARSLEKWEGHGARILGFVAPPGTATPPDSIELDRAYRVFPLEKLRGLLVSHFVIDDR